VKTCEPVSDHGKIEGKDRKFIPIQAVDGNNTLSNPEKLKDSARWHRAEDVDSAARVSGCCVENIQGFARMITLDL
jgi:hypothetical protein